MKSSKSSFHGRFLCLCRLVKRDREMGMRFTAVVIRVAWCEVERVIVSRKVSVYDDVEWKRERGR